MEEQDVKVEETEVTEDASTEEQPSEIEQELAEMFRSEESDKIPYGRFKEVNEKYKATKGEVDRLKAEMDARIAEAVKNAKLEALVSEKPVAQDDIEEFTFEDTSSKQIKALEERIAKQEQFINNQIQKLEYKDITNRLKSLKKSYPNMDEDTVLAYKQKFPKYDLEDLAKHDHDRRHKMVAALVEKMINEKKQAAKEGKIIGREQIKAFAEKTKDRKTLTETEEAIRKALGE